MTSRIVSAMVVHLSLLRQSPTFLVIVNLFRSRVNPEPVLPVIFLTGLSGALAPISGQLRWKTPGGQRCCLRSSPGEHILPIPRSRTLTPSSSPPDEHGFGRAEMPGGGTGPKKHALPLLTGLPSPLKSRKMLRSYNTTVFSLSSQGRPNRDILTEVEATSPACRDD